MRFTVFNPIPFTLLVMSACFEPPVRASVTYSVADLGAIGDSSFASAVNDSGAVAGSCRMPKVVHVAVVWQRGRLKRLDNRGARFSQAVAINNWGQIVGSFGGGPLDFSPGADGRHAFIWKGRGIIDLTPSAFSSEGMAINDRGQVLLQVYDGTPAAPKMFLWQRGSLHHIADSAGLLTCINNRSHAAGSNILAVPSDQTGSGHRGVPRAVLWDGHTARNLLPADQARLCCGASAISNHDVVVGNSAGWTDRIDEGPSHALIWKEGRMMDLGTLPGARSSQACGINNSDEAVGTSCADIGNSMVFTAVVWKQGRIINLNELISPDSGWVLEYANAINNKGWIVGEGTHNRQSHAFLLKPIPSQPRS